MKTLHIWTMLLPILGASVHAEGFETRVPMQSPGTDTYYVQGHIQGFGAVDLMVDTGSSYSVISETTLATLLQSGTAIYVKELEGVMADGSRKLVPIYLISGINVGGTCMIRDVETAVFPTRIRPILGMSALRKVSPFTFSLEPPNLLLSDCKAESTDGIVAKIEATEAVVGKTSLH